MVISGLQMRWQRLEGGSGPVASALRLMTIVAATIVFTLISACSTTATFGTMPPVERLSSLKVGMSKQSDVVSALGEPRGFGAVRWAADAPELPVLYYEYAQSEGMKVRLKILLVFLQQDVYTGYMWFSSGQLLQAKP